MDDAAATVIPYLRPGALVRSRQCRYESKNEWAIGIITAAKPFQARFYEMNSLEAHRQRANSPSTSCMLISVLWQQHAHRGECFFTVRPETEHNWEILERA